MLLHKASHRNIETQVKWILCIYPQGDNLSTIKLNDGLENLHGTSTNKELKGLGH